MSRAFVKEDVEVPEHSRRRRGTSGLPPGALNYLTERGARRLREQATKLHSAGKADDAKEIEQMLGEATIVPPPEEMPGTVTFGATVTVQTVEGATESYHIVGVDELDIGEDAVSWVSPQGRALLGAKRGQKLALVKGEKPVTILKIEHP